MTTPVGRIEIYRPMSKRDYEHQYGPLDVECDTVYFRTPNIQLRAEGLTHRQSGDMDRTLCGRRITSRALAGGAVDCVHCLAKS